MNVRVVAGAVAVLLLLAACSDSGGDTATSTTTTTAPGSTTSTTDPDDFSVPDEITPEYAERVINELLRIESEALRLSIEAGTVPPEAVELLRSINSSTWIDVVLSDYSQLARSQFDGMRADAGSWKFEVTDLLFDNERCLQIAGDLDTSQVLTDKDSVTDKLLVLLVESTNHTGWVVQLDLQDSPGGREQADMACER